MSDADASNCFDEETLLLFVQGRASPTKQADIELHLDACDVCRRVTAEASRFVFHETMGQEDSGRSPDGVAGRPAGGLELPTSGRVSRYQILEPIGMGATGVVYLAYDPELRRRIALKLIRTRGESDAERALADERLLREARAMAQLAHPNVVNIFDAGTHEGLVFIAMELVEGTTLAEWLRQPRRSWQEIVQRFVQAGRGLAAAHAAHIVHRDFKPENVLVGRDERARVTDFGLAHELEAGPSADAPAAQTAQPDAGDSGPRTRRAGTPAFMAPEQFLGKETDARTDQFGFCVALYGALSGHHPFGRETLKREPIQKLARAVLEGKLRSPPADSPVPAAVWETLARGLQVDPQRRFSDMAPLLADLERYVADVSPGTRARSRWRMVLAGMALVIALLLATGLSTPGRSWLAGLGARCGNGVVEGSEACDDGNRSDQDGCLSSCQLGACGDGKVRAEVEQCDDGNLVNGDGCNSRCLRCDGGDASFTWADNGHCYTRHDAPATISEARSVCEGVDGHLVTYGSELEELTVWKALLPEEKDPVWVGLVHRWLGGGVPENVGFVWETGEPSAFWDRYWAMGEPRPAVGNCVSQQAGSEGLEAAISPMRWRVTECWQRAIVVCESSGWALRPRDTHAYLPVRNPKTWDDAVAVCAARGAHLASVVDEDEHTFVAGLPLHDVWLGADDSKTAGAFQWVTGEPFTFDAFAPNQPDQLPGERNCLVQHDRVWWDRKCDREYSYLCEIDQ